jgi:16S rRNA (guanine527-N7)-methyltransferase
MNSFQFLQAECEKADFALNPDQLQSLCRYAEELAKWSRKMNLVAPASLESLLADHFLDSLCLYPFMQDSFSLLDVGTGAGFPGLVLGAVCPDLQVTLVEPRAKRISFLNHIIRTLKITNIHIIPERLEKGMDVGSFTSITSRAFAELALFLPLVEKCLAADGLVYCMKGPKGEEELLKFQQENPESALQLKEKIKAAYPLRDHGRCLMVFEKSG